MDPTIKSLTITGTAAEDATRSRLKGSKSRKKMTEMKDEEDEFTEQIKSFSSKTKPPIIQPIQKQSNVQVQENTIKPVVKPIEQIKQTNVVLNPPKQARVKLQPKSQLLKTPELNTTRKARRIKLNVSNLTHRFTRAKKVKDETEQKPVESIRDYLVQRGVIQEKSKAPEKMLRSMYSDFMLLKGQAL
jgi:hypothetical protein